MFKHKAKKATEKERSKKRKVPKLEKVPKPEDVQLLAYDQYLKLKNKDGRATSRKLAKRRRKTS